MRLRGLSVVLALGTASVGVVAACVGDDPDTGNTTTPDGGGSDAPNGSDTSPGDDGGSDGNLTQPSPVVTMGVGWGFACAARKDGTLWCWGANDKGQCAQPLAGGEMCSGVPCRKPTRVDGLSDVVSVGASNGSACAATKSGAVYCWGQNVRGVLGHPTSDDPDCGGGANCTATPKVVNGVTDAVEVVVGTYSACARTTTGNVFCWGYNAVGTLGNGGVDGGDLGAAPVVGFGTNGATQLAIDSGGHGHVCAMRADGTLWCWGRNSGSEMGYDALQSPQCTSDTGNEACQKSPHEVRDSADAAVKTVTSIAATDGANCAALAGGTVKCWGYNLHGVSAVPDAAAVPLTPAVRTAAQGLSAFGGTFYHQCGIGAGREVKCWGENTFGELGVTPNATTETCAAGPCSSTPVLVSGVSAEKVFGGEHISFALTAEGKLLAWGANTKGQLGHPPAVGEGSCASPCSPTPVEVVLP